MPGNRGDMVSETTYIVIVTLLAVLVGGLVPVLYQLTQTLRSTRKFLDQTGRRFNTTLEQVTAAATRVDRLGAVMEEHAKGLKPAVEAAAELGRSMHQMRDSLKATATIASALGPILVSLLRTVRPASGDSDQAGSTDSAGHENGKYERSASEQVTRRDANKEESSHGIQ